MIEKRIEKLLSWLSKHYRQFIGKPTNGHRSIAEADLLLRDLSAGRRRICDAAKRFTADNDEAEELMGDGDVSGTIRS